jgi:hypothetical protein
LQTKIPKQESDPSCLSELEQVIKKKPIIFDEQDEKIKEILHHH